MLVEKEIISPGTYNKWKRKADCHPESRYYAKGLCQKCYYNTSEQKEKRRIASKESIAKGKHLEWAYGITLEDYESILSKQGGGYAICRKEVSGRDRDINKRLVIDHCHKTNKIRGLLCHKCNMGIGYFNDNPELLVSASNYINQ